MPFQSDERMSWDNSDVVVKEEVDHDSDATVFYEPEENDLVSYDFIFSCKIRINKFFKYRFLPMEPLVR